VQALNESQLGVHHQLQESQASSLRLKPSAFGHDPWLHLCFSIYVFYCYNVICLGCVDLFMKRGKILEGVKFFFFKIQLE